MISCKLISGADPKLFIGGTAANPIFCKNFWNSPMIFTARKRSLRRLCFQRCLSVHRGGVCPIACLDTHTPSEQTTLLGVGTPPGADTPPCCACWEIRATSERYASYWNAFLLIKKVQKDLPMKLYVSKVTLIFCFHPFQSIHRRLVFRSLWFSSMLYFQKRLVQCSGGSRISQRGLPTLEGVHQSIIWHGTIFAASCLNLNSFQSRGRHSYRPLGSAIATSLL